MLLNASDGKLIKLEGVVTSSGTRGRRLCVALLSKMDWLIAMSTLGALTAPKAAEMSMVSSNYGTFSLSGEREWPLFWDFDAAYNVP